LNAGLVVARPPLEATLTQLAEPALLERVRDVAQSQPFESGVPALVEARATSSPPFCALQQNAATEVAAVNFDGGREDMPQICVNFRE
jgi:hypothetical protein